MCSLGSCDRNGFVRERAKHVSRFGDVHDTKRNRKWIEKMYLRAESGAAPGSDVAVVRGWGVERVFTDVVILSCDRQDHSISQRWLGSGERYTHIPVLLGRRRQPKPNLINKCSSPVPQLSEMKMILRGSEQSDRDSTGRNREGHKEREKETRVRAEGGTCSEARLLKGKASLYWRARR